MEVKVKQIDRFKFSVQARAHLMICDQPLENGGEDAGMTPPELLLGSLGTCAEFYAVQYLRARRRSDGECREADAACATWQLSHSCNVPGRTERGTDRGAAALGASLP